MIEVNIKPLELDKTCKTLAMGWEVYHWPETIALMQRLGVDMSKPIQRAIIDLDYEGLVCVYLKQRGSDVDA